MRMTDWLVELVCFDNEGGQGGDGGGAGGDGGGAGGDGGGAGGDGGGAGGDGGVNQKTLTQEDFNRAMAKEKRKWRDQQEQMEGNYQRLLEEQNLSDERRTELETDLEQLRASMRTKEQQAAHDAQQAKEKHEKELNAATERGDHYQKLFEESTIERAISDAASDNDGFNSSQFVALLGPKTKIIEEIDGEGQKTGKLVPRIDWEVTGEDGTVQTVQKTPKDVVELMKGDPGKYGNMFKAHVSSGIGSGTAGGVAKTGSVDVSKLSESDRMAYLKSPEGRKALGLKPL